MIFKTLGNWCHLAATAGYDSRQSSLFQERESEALQGMTGMPGIPVEVQIVMQLVQIPERKISDRVKHGPAETILNQAPTIADRL